MTIKTMQDTIIHKYGFEHPATVYFFNVCEIFGDNDLMIAMSYELALNWINEKEEEV